MGLLLCATGLALLHADERRFYRPRGRFTALTGPVEVARLTAPAPGQGDELGRSVAAAVGVIVVGAPGNVTNPQHHAAGAAHVFVGSGWTWRHRQRLVAFDREPGDSFGRAVAISGDTIAVGAEHDVVDGVPAAGSVHVYVREGRRWSLERKLVAPDPRIEAHFGHSLALEDDTLVVGTWATDTVYVFERTGAWWAEPQMIRAHPGQGGNFGHSLALDSDTLVVGAEWRGHSGLQAAGGVSVFTRIDGSWVFEQDLIANDPVEEDQFGASVAIQDGLIVMGAPQNDDDLNENRGAAYVFARSDDGWLQQQKLVPGNAFPWLRFGWSVALSGDNLLIGVPWDTPDGLPQAGSVHLFRRSGDTWIASGVLSPVDAAPWDLLGEVAFVGHTAVLGARLADVGDRTDAGAAYVFLIP
jgi:hypothetical protein